MPADPMLMSLAPLPEAVNACRYYADQLYAAQYPNQAMLSAASDRAAALERYAAHVTVGSNEPPIVYTMAKVAFDVEHRRMLRIYLDQLDAVDGDPSNGGGLRLARPTA